MIHVSKTESQRIQATHHDPSLEQTITMVMEELVCSIPTIETLTRDDAYELWQKAVYVTCVAEVYTMKLLSRYKQLAPREPDSTSDSAKLIAAIAARGINLEDLIKSLSDKNK